MDIVFEKWREKLLDAGKGNKLINYKETSRSIEILAPDYETVFHRLTNGDGLSFYDVDSFVREWNKAKAEEFGEDYDADYSLSKIEVLQELEGKLKKGQVLSYKISYKTKLL